MGGLWRLSMILTPRPQKQIPQGNSKAVLGCSHRSSQEQERGAGKRHWGFAGWALGSTGEQQGGFGAGAGLSPGLPLGL